MFFPLCYFQTWIHPSFIPTQIISLINTLPNYILVHTELYKSTRSSISSLNLNQFATHGLSSSNYSSVWPVAHYYNSKLHLAITTEICKLILGLARTVCTCGQFCTKPVFCVIHSKCQAVSGLTMYI